MTLSIRTKLFLTLLLTSLLVATTMLVFTHWSFRQGLVELAETRQSDYIDQVAQRLAEIHRRDGGWSELATNRALWIGALTGRGLGLHGRYRRSVEEPGHRQWLGTDRQTSLWPPERVLEQRYARGQPAPVGLRLMLLDADGAILYGREALLPNARRYPVTVDGRPVGSLALVPGPVITEVDELRFLERQTMALVVVALGMTGLSGLLAWLLARRLAQPLSGFQATTRRLAAGDYQARAASYGGDELGRLGQDLNALAQALERHEQARRQWVADISHELRTPLALLRAEIEALQDGVRPLNQDSIAALHADTLRLGRLVDDLYELSMTDLGALSYRKESIDPLAVLAADCEAFATRFAAAGLTIRFRPDSTEPTRILGDAQRLSQLFRNLLQNSFQYTDPGGHLTVTTRSEGAMLNILFEDTGPGVPTAALEHLFDRLYRTESSRNRDSGGAGLGLAICRNIVAAHDGRISAAPATGGGLAIRLQLPTIRR